MKQTLIIFALMCSMSAAVGQVKKPGNRNFKVILEWKTECMTSTSSQWWSNHNPPTYDQIFNSFRIWSKGHRILSFKVIGMQEVKSFTKEETTPSKFKCPEPLKITIDTTKSHLFSQGSTFSQYLKPMGLRFGQWLKFEAWSGGKNNLYGNTDSVKVFVNKSQLHWLNDSTAVITKP